MDLGISGRTALVTGADSGIGLATARELLAEGVRVAVTDVDPQRLREAAASLPGDVVTAAADLTVPGDVERLRREVEQALGPVDVLVQAAGTTGAQGAFADVDDEGWRFTLDTDLLGPVRLLRAFLPGMAARGWGRVVVIASEDAVQPYPDELPYVAAKAGLRALAKGLSKTYGEQGVLVNTVSPAYIATPMTDAMMRAKAQEDGTTFDEAVDAFLAQERPGITARRRGRAEEVAAVVAFLCSERASFVNGSDYRVDSGSVATL